MYIYFRFLPLKGSLTQNKTVTKIFNFNKIIIQKNSLSLYESTVTTRQVDAISTFNFGLRSSFIRVLHYSTDAHNPFISDSAFVPFISYSNADKEKVAILESNKNRAGIYRWVNLTTGNTYIGSSGNLSNRFSKYFNINFLVNEVTKNNSMIYRSLFKNGYSNFRL